MRAVCRSRSADGEWGVGVVVACGNEGDPKRDGLLVEADEAESPYRPSCNSARNESGMLMLREGEVQMVKEEKYAEVQVALFTRDGVTQ